MIVPLIVIAQSYVEPVGPPPNSAPIGRPALEFLNGSTATQRKVGAFLVGQSNNAAKLPNCTYDTGSRTWTATSGCASLCLNADVNTWITTTDPNSCIRNWQDLRSLIGGPFLRLLPDSTAGNIDGTDGACGGALPDPDCGVVSFVSDPTKNQLISLMAEAYPSGNGASGLRAMSSSTSHYAGWFQGNVKIVSPTGNVELCLNGVCIDSWSDAQPGLPADAVKLQTTNFLTPQTGTVGLNGPLFVNSLVLGTPAIATPVSQTCGDGICSRENNETNINCPLDC